MADAVATQAREPEWLTARRQRGSKLAGELPLPTPKTEGWQFTDLGELDIDAFAPVEGGDASARERAVALFDAVEGAQRLDQVDAAAGPPAGVAGPSEPIVVPLDVAAERWPELVQSKLGSIVAGEDPFVARNDAAWSGGAFVYVPAGQRLDAPVLLTAVQEAGERALNWRTLIVLEEGAEAEVWEQYLSADPDVEGLFNTVVEISVGPNANLRYMCGQGLGEKAWIFGSQRAEVDRDATLEWVALGFGSARGKVRMETKLAGQGASARVTGAYAGRHRQHLDFDTTQEHAAANTTSDLAFRGLLDDRATAVWRGMIRVDPGAQQTDAFQESRNLLLSKRAHADAIPGLEILANDVRCTHAAAIAQIDADQLFYLQSHGLPKPIASRLVIEGFLQELVERFPAGHVHDALATALERRLGEILDKE